jgi:hypothetical protein
MVEEMIWIRQYDFYETRMKQKHTATVTLFPAPPSQQSGHDDDCRYMTLLAV